VGRRRRCLFSARLLARLQQHVERGRRARLGLDGRRLDRSVGLRGAAGGINMTLPWSDPRIVRGMEAQLARRHSRLAAGDSSLGWKVGFGAPAAMKKFQITAPLVGYLLKSGGLASGATASLRGWIKPVAEPEIAVVVGHDLPPGGDRAAAARAI